MLVSNQNLLLEKKKLKKTYVTFTRHVFLFVYDNDISINNDKLEYFWSDFFNWPAYLLIIKSIFSNT